jgi:CheY-like chemotaxis protein
MRCLIVDDNDAFLEVARNLLEGEGLSVVGVATTGAEALRQLEAWRPDVVLVDVFLRHESGLELARNIVADGRRDDVTVILISTHAEADLADLVASIPAARFLSKAELSANAIRGIVDGRRG